MSKPGVAWEGPRYYVEHQHVVLSRTNLYDPGHHTWGLFPNPREIELSCDCPDWADMCKHIAAVLYGIGARLDHQPELLFLLRNVDHEALISAELDMHAATDGTGKRRRLASQNLSDVFGVDIEEPPRPVKRKLSSASKKAIKPFNPTPS